MAREAVTLMHRYFEQVWNRGDLRYIDQRLARDWVGHAPGEDLDGPERLKEYVSSLRATHAGLRYTVMEAIAEADRVAVRWTAGANLQGDARAYPGSGTGSPITGMTFARLADGKIVEAWAESLTLAVL